MSDREPAWALPPELSASFAMSGIDPEVLALLTGPRQPQRYAVEVEYQVPVKLRWWRRAWLWLRCKPVPTTPTRVLIPNASVTPSEPTQ